MPVLVMKTETLPPLKVALSPGVELVRMYRLSRSFCISMTLGPAGGCA